MADVGYSLPDQAFERVQAKIGQRRLGGQTVTPAMLSAFYKAELDTQEENAMKRRALNISQQQFADTLSQRERQFNEQMGINKDVLENQRMAGIASAALKLPPAANSAYNLYKTLGLGGNGKINEGIKLPEPGTTNLGDETAIYDSGKWGDAEAYPSDFTNYNFNQGSTAAPETVATAVPTTPEGAPATPVDETAPLAFGTTLGYGAAKAGAAGGTAVTEGLLKGTGQTTTPGLLESQGQYWDPATHSIKSLSESGTQGLEATDAMPATYSPEVLGESADTVTAGIDAAPGFAEGVTDTAPAAVEGAAQRVPWIGPAVTAGKIGYDLVTGDYGQAVQDTPIVSGYNNAYENFDEGNWGGGTVKAVAAPFQIDKIPGVGQAMTDVGDTVQKTVEDTGGFFGDMVSDAGSFVDDLFDW